jgi:glycosyltransferase involved in cell wall biosynthesis
MHIVISILHRPINPTGVCRFAVNLAECLADTQRVDKITLLIGGWQQDYFKRSFSLTSSKIVVQPVGIENTMVKRNLWYLFGLPKLARKLKADIVHHSFPIPFFRNLFSSPTVSTIHDLYPYEVPENFGYPNVIFNQYFLKKCIQSSHGLTCVSHVTLNSLRKYFPGIEKEKETTVVYNHVDFSRVIPRMPSTFAENASPFLLSVAQHRKNKNLHLLIDAFSGLLKKKLMPATSKLVLVGSAGPETENLKQQIGSLSLLQNVIMLSSLGDDELCWLYKSCEMLIVPSSAEGFCLPLAEALFLSCKVVCSDIEIFREVGSSGCTYFSLEGDVIQDLENAIQITLHKPNNKNNPDLRFSKQNAAAGYLTLYESVKK